jgi:hypothetical protein
MTGGEIIAVGKAAEAVGKKALAEDEKTQDVLLRIAEGTPEMTAAARNMAARTALRNGSSYCSTGRSLACSASARSTSRTLFRWR